MTITSNTGSLAQDLATTTDTTSTELESGLTRIAYKDPVETADYGDKEILRVYSTELRVLGSPGVSILIETPLRFDAAKAKRRAHDSTEAHREAFLRACKLERAANHTPESTTFLQGEIVLLRTRPVAPRISEIERSLRGPR